MGRALTLGAIHINSVRPLLSQTDWAQARPGAVLWTVCR